LSGHIDTHYKYAFEGQNTRKNSQIAEHAERMALDLAGVLMLAP
jgi:hypothetical protein